MKVHAAAVPASQEGVLAGVTAVGLRDGEAVEPLDGRITKSLL